MKTVTLNILKKNRKFFAAKINSYDCKIIIDSNSENLELGEQELLVEDKSVRTKYGTEIIYQLCGEAKAKDEPKQIITLKHDRYNSHLVKSCRELGGRWDAENKIWVFSSIVADKIDELDEEYNDDCVVAEIEAIADLSNWQGPISFCGYTIARATGRDSGATLGDEVSMIEGKISSGGSAKNWTTTVKKESKFRLKVPKTLLDNCREGEEKEWEIKKIKL
jgi:hypothetical protein